MAFIIDNWAVLVGALLLLLASFAFGYSRGRDSAAPGMDRGRLDRAPPNAPATPAAPARPLGDGLLALPPEALTRIHDALRAGQKIQAIKIMRETTGLGLAEAKDAVEAMER